MTYRDTPFVGRRHRHGVLTTFCVALIVGFGAIGEGEARPQQDLVPQVEAVQNSGGLLAQGRRTCKSVSTCEEAVRLWCGGYSRADGDKDGIPCETVCSTKQEVDEIRARIGC
ncbi:excalibur calcium-binding domain-containing protein [Jiella mangrovi]|uniref:Excalibur calcium-binding domain-containing protein n=1 Tax=Jiella mangrovi TaxID=2821407 RepID=A0ABS4BI74_9HYPH|nr:excalibur calcium-binding domain-containing protein [Jiella mangrovi]MBP0615876.1 excalibur calcium-binding domain-containing protein [Jiella mangrovi]